MATDPCDGCGRRVSVGGGIANVWTLESTPTEGLRLELADGSDHFLCFDCVNDLPEEPVEADVQALPDRPQSEPVGESPVVDEGPPWIAIGTAVGAVIGVGAGVAVGNLEWGLFTGAALGLGVAALVERRGE